MNLVELAAANEVKLSDPNVCPPVAVIVRAFLLDMSSQDIPCELVWAYRSYNQQNIEYQKGRTTPGPKVTDCQPGHSWHNFGLAFDVCPYNLINTPGWSPSNPLWTRLYETAMTHGFVCGTLWRIHPDLPHIEMTGKYPSIVPDEARVILLDYNPGNPDSGLPGVWKSAGLLK